MVIGMILYSCDRKRRIMKSIILVVMSIGLVSWVEAQSSDSVRTRPKKQVSVSPKKSAASEEKEKEVRSYPTENMKRVSARDNPEALIKTLQSPEYKGWEEGTFYYNKRTDEYSLLLPQSPPGVDSMKLGREFQGKRVSPRTGWYHFKSDGTPIH